MDPICHTLAGAALGEAGLKHRTTLGLSTVLIAANLPDVDAVTYLTDHLSVYYRRGWTHGVVAMALLPPLVAGAMLLWDRAVLRRRANPRAPAQAGPLLLLAYAGTLSHTFLDFLNSYGIRLLKPLSDRWFYGDALFIIDPFMYLFLGGAVVVAHVSARARRPFDSPAAAPGLTPGSLRAARVGLAFAAAYVVGMLASNIWARQIVAEGLARAGRADARFMVTPVLANPLRREVVIDAGDRYERGFIWFDPLPHFRPAGFGVSKGLQDPDANRAMLTPLAQQYLAWSRFPFFVVDRTGGRTRVFLSDYRYSDPTARGNWASVEIDVN